MRADEKGCVSDCKYDLSGGAINYWNKDKTKCIAKCTSESAYVNLIKT